MKNLKVSIIIPVYNGSNYLKQAIDSALNQTYNNIEVLVVNDGSNDGGKTKNIALSYGNKIKYIEKENNGVSSALNMGIKSMTGEYFSWLSHDDLYEPDKVLKQINELKKYDENTILYSNYKVIDENNNFVKNVILDHDEYMLKPLNSIINMDINGITLLIPKKAFLDCSMFDENLRCVQDYDLWIKMMKKYKFIHMKEILASSRAHAKQVSNVSEKVITEGNQFYMDLVSKIDLKTKIMYEGSEYLFLDNLEKKLRYNSNYIKAACYVKEKMNEILSDYKTNNNHKLLWLVDAEKKGIKEIQNISKKVDTKIVEIGTYNKKLKGFKYFSQEEKVKAIEYKYIYLENDVMDFEKMMKILEVSDASIIANYLLEDENIVGLDKYSKFINLDYNSIIIKNYGIKISDTNDKFLMYIKAFHGGNIVLNKYKKNKYTITDYEMKEVLKSALKENLPSDSIASLCYQVAVINNKESNETGNKKVSFYETCDKYNALNYSRSWHLYNKIINFIKRNK